jgi:Flp pilus assembly protein TadG
MSAAAPITASATRTVTGALRRFARARRAAMGVEFALLIPLLAQTGVGVARLSDSLTAVRPAAMIGSTTAIDLRTGRTGAP